MFCHSSSGKAKTAKEEIENQTAWEDSEKKPTYRTYCGNCNTWLDRPGVMH
jgi:hypothetical protein